MTVKGNLDLNIWDRWSYETNGFVKNGWVINTYLIPHEGAGYGTGQQTSHSLHLRTRDAKRMGLGVNTDEDFWIDARGLLEDENTPRKVRVWLERAMEEAGV